MAAALLSLVLTFCDYLLNNWRYPLVDDVESLAVKEYFLHTLPRADDDSVLFINVAFDKQLVDVTDDFGDTIGKSVITDRAVLAHLLGIARQADYKFLVLDVRFEEGMETPDDSILWSRMSSLPHFAFSTHAEMATCAPDSLKGVQALADYGATLTTGFTRWQYLQSDVESMPLRIYSTVDGSTIQRKGILYFDQGRLCYNSLFIPLSADVLEMEKPGGELRYPLAGGDLFRLNTDEEIAAMMKGKIVVIGDYNNDVHDTYIGSVPGPVLINQAYSQLHQGRHLVKWTYVCFLLVLFFAISCAILASGSLINRIPFMQRHPILGLLASFIGWEIILSAVSLILYLVASVNFNTLVPSAAFTVLAWTKSQGGSALGRKISNIISKFK